MDTILTFVLGVVLRLGIPLAVTALALYLLRRLDERWQKEALAVPVLKPTSRRPCWEVKGCSDAKRRDCPAAAKADVPCWQVFRAKSGRMKEGCLDCDVFRQAPVPVIS